MSASDDQLDPASKDWSMMDDHAYISTVEDEEAAMLIATPADDFSEIASFEATTDDDAETSELTKPPTPTPERIEDIILGKKIPKELKSILELSKEAKFDVNMVHKRKSVNDSENSGSSERSETPDRNKKRSTSSKVSPQTEPESLIDDANTDSTHMTRIVGTKEKGGWKRRVEGSIGGATTSADHKIVKRMPMPPRNSANVRNHKDSFCWQCHRNGVNVSCETCPRSYHIKCVKTPVMDLDHWPCPECVAILTAENVKTRSVAMKDVSLEQLCELLKFAHRRMVQVADTDPFMQPVNESEFPDYYSYIVQPMDLSTLEKNIKENTYGSTIAFEADAKWILHNSIIFNTYQSKLTSTAKTIVRICKHEMSEIENCYTCYLNANTKKNWFVEVCPKPHPIIWAKLKGFPYWPAKAMCTNNVGMVDCRFFGAHDRAWVSYKDCYLYCQQDPNSNKQKRLDIIACIKEVEVYIENLRKIYDEFKYAPFKSLYDPENELKQLQLLLPKYNFDEPTIKTVPKIKIVAKKATDTELTTFKVKEPKEELKPIEQFSESEEDEEESESDESSEDDDEEVLSSSSDEEDIMASNIRNKRNPIVEDDSDFSESEEIKIIKSMHTRRRGTRRTSTVSNISLNSLANSEQSGRNSAAENMKTEDDSVKPLGKDPDNNSSKMSDVLMKKLSENNDADDESADDKDTEMGIEEDIVNKTKDDSIDGKKNEEIDMSFESSEQEDDRSDKEVPHITGDMDVDDDDGKVNDPEQSANETCKDMELEDNTNKPTSESAPDKLAGVESATADQTKEPPPSEDTTQDSTESDEQSTTDNDAAEEPKEDAASSITSSVKPNEPSPRRSSKESKADNPIPELIKLTHFVESTGQKRKKSHDSSSTDSDVVHHSKKPTKEDGKSKDNNSTSNGYESIQSILKRQGKTRTPIPQPQTSKASDTVTSSKDTPQSDKTASNNATAVAEKFQSSTDVLTSATAVNTLAEIKSEPDSPGFSSSSSDEEDEYTDNRYMMAKLQYLSALNISEKRPQDQCNDKKQKEIRTRSKTEELTKGRSDANEGMLKNIASYLENAGDEITIHKKRHDHPTSNAIKALQNNSSVTLKQRARKSFPKPVGQQQQQQQQQQQTLLQMGTRSSFPQTATVLSISKGDSAALKQANITPTIILKSNTIGTGSPKTMTGELKRSISILNTNIAGVPVVTGSTPIGGVANTVATTTTSNLMILTHPQAGSVVLPAGSTLPQSLAPYLSSYYYVTPSTQVINATATTNAAATTNLPPLSAIQPLQLLQSQVLTTADSTDKGATLDLISSATAGVGSAGTAATTTTITTTSLNSVVGSDPITIEDRNVYDPNILNGLVPENITRAVADLFCKRVPPKLKPRPPGALSNQFESGVSSDAGPITARINSVAHRFTDYFRGMLVETLSDLSGNNPEATIASLRLENETLRQKHTEEMLEIKKNVNTLMCDIQKSVSEEKDKIIEETKTKCEQETIRRVNETKSKQWCANCMKEAQFYCCWNTSYCDYPCQAKHWLKHQYKCTQESNNQTQSHGHAVSGASSAAGGNVAGKPQSGQPIVLRHSAPPPKGFTGKILKTTSKVLMNSRGNAKIPMNVLRRASNGSGHITIIESTPGNYELVGNGPITLAPTKNSPQGLLKVKNTGGAAKHQQTITSNLPPNSKAILLSKNAATPAVNSLMKNSKQQNIGSNKQANTRNNVDATSSGSNSNIRT